MSATETIDVSHTSRVSGDSKFIVLASPKLAFAHASLSRYDTPLAMIIITRITKIQTRSCTWTVGSATATRMNGDQRDAGDAVGLEAVCARPHRVAGVVAGAVGDHARDSATSSSLMLKTIFIRSEPMSAILVKMPPAIRSTDAPSDSPIAKPMKQEPA